MRPFLVTELQAGKLPRWGLLLICALYVLPGFVGRDPWRLADAAGFGVALTMARGGLSDWLLPNIAGEAVTEDGPLAYWLGAALARAMPWLPEHAMVRAAAVMGLALTLVALWYASYALARRQGVQPADPFGAGASRVDFGRAIADCTLLVLMATLGLIGPMHETTADAAQVVLCAFFLYGAATALERPLTGGVIAGLAIGASVATRGLLPAAALAVTALALPAFAPQYRLIAARWLPLTLGLALLVGGAWPLALLAGDDTARAHLTGWLATNFAPLGLPRAETLRYWARTLPWFLWPAWPIALWALWRWRGLLAEPAIALPILQLATTLLVALWATEPDRGALLPACLPLAMLAAAGLPTLRRSMVSLIDWFAVITYSLIGIAVWAYWLAFVTGVPERMARSASRIAPGFEPAWLSVDVLLGVAASFAWLLLVRWRISRQPPMIWRAVVLSCGGLVLAWFLLMTLWLPAFNQRNTYREVAQNVAAVLPAGNACVASRGLGRAQRASLQYFANLRFGEDPERCGWLLVQDEGPAARTSATVPPGWVLRWEGGRPRDQDERLRIFERLR